MQEKKNQINCFCKKSKGQNFVQQKSKIISDSWLDESSDTSSEDSSDDESVTRKSARLYGKHVQVY